MGRRIGLNRWAKSTLQGAGSIETWTTSGGDKKTSVVLTPENARKSGQPEGRGDVSTCRGERKGQSKPGVYITEPFLRNLSSNPGTGKSRRGLGQKESENAESTKKSFERVLGATGVGAQLEKDFEGRTTRHHDLGRGPAEKADSRSCYRVLRLETATELKRRIQI